MCDSTRCETVNGEAPLGIPCNTQPCGPTLSWVTSQWTFCSGDCGGGIQSRNVTCISSEFGEVPVSDDLCIQQAAELGAKPETTKSCNESPCPTYSFVASEWGECDVTCGMANRTRTVSCVSSIGSSAPWSSCDGQVIPVQLEPCKLPACESRIAVMPLEPNKDRFAIGDIVTVSFVVGDVPNVEVHSSTDGESFTKLKDQPSLKTGTDGGGSVSFSFEISAGQPEEIFFMVKSVNQEWNFDVSDVIYSNETPK
jgi:hypothetical protein